jgi:hypothetical protein
VSERERVLNRSRSETTHSDEHPEQLCSKAATWPFPYGGLRSRHSEHEVLSIDFDVIEGGGKCNFAESVMTVDLSIPSRYAPAPATAGVLLRSRL